MKSASLIFSVVASVCIGGMLHADDKIPLDKLPKAVTDAVKAKFPKAELVSAEKEDENGKTLYEVVIKDNGGKIEVKLTPEGEIVEIEKAIELKDLSKTIKDAIEAKYPKSTLKEAEEVTKGDKKTIEVVVITADKKTIEVVLDLDGKILKTEEEKENKKEEKKKD